MKNWLYHYFIPNNGNDFKPHILQRTAVVLMAGLLVLSFTLANLHSFLWVSSSWLVGTVLPAVVVELTNESRADAALGGLKRNSTLDEAARLKAQHMAEVGYFAHYAPDGTSPWHWFDEVSYDYVHAGENLAVHFSDSDEVVDAWLESPSHRANIMNGNYTEIGVGTAKGTFEGFDTVFVVQLFGTPAATRVPAAARSDTGVVAAAEALPQPEPEVAAAVNPAPAPEVVPVAEEVTPEPVPTPAPVEITPEPVLTSVTNESGQTVALMSDTVTTSRSGTEFDGSTAGTQSQPPVSTVARIATQPQQLLNMVYSFTAVFVALALILSIFIEIRKQHPVQIAYGIALLLIMIGLSYLHVVVAGGAVIA